MALYVRESGRGDAPSIVLLHGGGASGWTWQLQLARLTDYHCIVPDLPEQGKSLTEGPFSIKGAAERVLSLIRKRAHGGRAQLEPGSPRVIHTNDPRLDHRSAVASGAVAFGLEINLEGPEMGGTTEIQTS